MAHAAQHQAAAAVQDGWICTSEALPPEGERILAVTHRGIVEVARREGDRWFTRGANHCRGILLGVAYWMPLRPLPEEIRLRLVDRPDSIQCRDAAMTKEQQP